jgi:formylglycine-generating enzyme required for sulfatase activity
MKLFRCISILALIIGIPMVAAAGDMVPVPVEALSADDLGALEVPAPFLIDTHEVTNAEFSAFLADVAPETEGAWRTWVNGEDPNFKIDIASESFDVVEGFETYPVVTVTLEGALGYAEWAGKAIPANAQWEAAARLGGSLSAVGEGETPGEDDGSTESDESAIDPSELGPVSVEDLTPDDLGLYGMLGNVWEWTMGEYETDYLSFMPTLGITPAAGPTLSIVRGGGFLINLDGLAEYPSAATSPKARFGNLGFRCVKEAD